jgi:SAM-dependent methyltransferase
MRRGEPRTTDPARDTRRLYGDLAWTWPIISPPEDYIEEAEGFVRLIREYARIPVMTLLDLGCGGGHNDATFKRHFQVVGMDVSEAMLSLARSLNPEVEYLAGDMRTVRLPRTFDAVVIADSIDYMLTEADLRAAFGTGAAHLRPGGVLVTYAEHEPGTFRQNRTVVTTRSRGEVAITVVETSYDPDPGDGTFEFTMVFLIRRGPTLDVHVDRHLNNLFPLDRWRTILQESGLEVIELRQTFGDEGPGVPTFVAIKPMP